MTIKNLFRLWLVCYLLIFSLSLMGWKTMGVLLANRSVADAIAANSLFHSGSSRKFQDGGSLSQIWIQNVKNCKVLKPEQNVGNYERRPWCFLSGITNKENNGFQPFSSCWSHFTCKLKRAIMTQEENVGASATLSSKKVNNTFVQNVPFEWNRKQWRECWKIFKFICSQVFNNNLKNRLFFCLAYQKNASFCLVVTNCFWWSKKVCWSYYYKKIEMGSRSVWKISPL